MKDREAWKKILGQYSKGDRVYFLKAFADYGTTWGKGEIVLVQSASGNSIFIKDGEHSHSEYLIPKAIVSFLPFGNWKLGERVRSKVTIKCSGLSACDRSAWANINKNRMGRIIEIINLKPYHLLLRVSFSGGAEAVYEDYEVKKVGKKKA